MSHTGRSYSSFNSPMIYVHFSRHIGVIYFLQMHSCFHVIEFLWIMKISCYKSTKCDNKNLLKMLGKSIRIFYQKWFHPNVQKDPTFSFMGSFEKFAWGIYNALSFYRSQKILAWSNFFVPELKLIHILQVPNIFY